MKMRKFIFIAFAVILIGLLFSFLYLIDWSSSIWVKPNIVRVGGAAVMIALMGLLMSVYSKPIKSKEKNLPITAVPQLLFALYLLVIALHITGVKTPMEMIDKILFWSYIIWGLGWIVFVIVFLFWVDPKKRSKWTKWE